MSEIVIGVDGGGSKTRVVVGTAESEILASVDGPKSAVIPGHAAESANVIADLVVRAIAEIAQPGAVVPRVLYCGVAGTGSLMPMIPASIPSAIRHMMVRSLVKT